MLECMLAMKSSAGVPSDLLKGIYTKITYTGSPPVRYLHAQAILDDVLYVFGGHAGGWTNTFWAYNLSTKVWTQKAAPPEGGTVRGPCLFAGNGKLYVIASFKGVGTTVYTYNPGTNTWTTHTSAGGGTGTTRIHAAILNNVAYILSGASVEPPFFAMLDLVTMQWTALTAPVGMASRWDYVPVVKGDYVYFVGGNANSGVRRDIWRYDTVNNLWENTGSYPSDDMFFYGSGFTYNDELYYVSNSKLYHFNLDTNIRTLIANWTLPGLADITGYIDGAYLFGGEQGSVKNDVWFIT